MCSFRLSFHHGAILFSFRLSFGFRLAFVFGLAFVWVSFGFCLAFGFQFSFGCRLALVLIRFALFRWNSQGPCESQAHNPPGEEIHDHGCRGRERGQLGQGAVLEPPVYGRRSNQQTRLADFNSDPEQGNEDGNDIDDDEAAAAVVVAADAVAVVNVAFDAVVVVNVAAVYRGCCCQCCC